MEKFKVIHNMSIRGFLIYKGEELLYDEVKNLLVLRGARNKSFLNVSQNFMNDWVGRDTLASTGRTIPKPEDAPAKIEEPKKDDVDESVIDAMESAAIEMDIKEAEADEKIAEDSPKAEFKSALKKASKHS